MIDQRPLAQVVSGAARASVEPKPQPLALHAVRRVVPQPALLDSWPSANRTERLVCIARGVYPVAIEGLFDARVAVGALIAAVRGPTTPA